MSATSSHYSATENIQVAARSRDFSVENHLCKEFFFFSKLPGASLLCDIHFKEVTLLPDGSAIHLHTPNSNISRRKQIDATFKGCEMNTPHVALINCLQQRAMRERSQSYHNHFSTVTHISQQYALVKS